MRRTSYRLIVACMLVCCGIGLAGSPKAERIQLLDHVSADPLLVMATGGATMSETYDGWMDMFARYASEEERNAVEAKLTEMEREIGCSIRDDLLARIGPEYALVLDLPPIDQLLGATAGGPAGIGDALSNLGILAKVNGPETVGGCLRKLLDRDEMKLIDEEGLVRIEIGVGGAGVFALYYGFEGDVFAIGPSPAFVRSSFQPVAKGGRLAEGEDFSKVFKHLDRVPTSVTYLNTPKAKALVEGSAFVRGAIASDPEANRIMTMMMDPEFSGSGLGSTSVEVEGGTRTTYFGPSALSGGFGGVAAAGIVAAIAVPNLLNATDRGKQKRTMADMRSAATAIEEFSIDENVYPGPTDGWVPLEELADSLSPMYIRVLPTTDGWGHTMLVWSDGSRYRIVSPGKDGELERDWRAAPGAGPTTEFSADIVFGDGQFLAWPEGPQN